MVGGIRLVKQVRLAINPDEVVYELTGPRKAYAR